MSTYFGAYCELAEKKPVDVTNPWTGTKVRILYLIYKVFDIDVNKIIDLFFEVRPEDGFLSFIKSKCFMTNGTLLSFIMTYDKSLGYWSYKIEIKKKFDNYYSFKAGKTYVFDLFEILNITEPFTASKKSFKSVIYIEFQRPGNLDYVFEDIYFSSIDYVIGRGRMEGVIVSYAITNDAIIDKPYYNIPGKLIDGIRIKFKVVEKGFKIPSLPLTQILGYVSIVVVLIVVALMIIYARKRGFKLK
ncbi:MAG: hypothetical protein DRJ30_06990 [Candidatus Methanomethylicota archaeon]|nr:MAG: hypothetical protein DRJ30_06990 [Candidatus Verstraetearchaeota archaeon]